VEVCRHPLNLNRFQSDRFDIFQKATRPTCAPSCTVMSADESFIENAL
jgi:hypothetical protein